MTATAAVPNGPPGLVWYAAYGSNMAAARLGHYLTGGRPPGALRVYPGARDPSPPLGDVPLWIPGQVYFALESTVWGGGMAFYDPDAGGETPARGYLLTIGQFSDLATQEMHRTPASDLEIEDAVTSGRHRYGPGRYETLVCAGTRGRSPVLTLTAPWSLADAELSAPSPEYLRMLAAGLQEAHGWDQARTAGYLAGLPGAIGSWTTADIAAMLAANPS